MKKEDLESIQNQIANPEIITISKLRRNMKQCIASGKVYLVVTYRKPVAFLMSTSTFNQFRGLLRPN